MKFIYSFKKDYEEAKYIDENPQEYERLISVIWPKFNLLSRIKAFVLGNMAVVRASFIWKKYEKETGSGFEKIGIEMPNVNCYLYNYGCQGWFDTDTKSIHVRFTKSPDKDFAESIVHELLHIATYKPEYGYSQRESLVDSCIERMSLSFIDFKPQDLKN